MLAAVNIERWMHVYANGEVAMIVLEKNPSLQRLTRELHAIMKRTEITEMNQVDNIRVSPFSRIRESVHFAEKNESRLLQLADVCAFVLKRKAMGGSDADRFFEPLRPQIQGRRLLNLGDSSSMPGRGG
jgi:hypothetical protein